ncbi:complex I NDUFA9 subunit family protein [Sphingomonas sp. GCM10030256]|uniref:complex I NDUFA9 subunit family protein n=1 Tax=Sphingomonas sp. GCM10030256 TaxID=3273427 RepID=UPI003607747B
MKDLSIHGRSRIVTVLGGGGFIGRYVCEQLFKTGVRVRVAQRRPRDAYFLQPLAAVGQLDLTTADMRRPGTLERAIEGAWSVINLVGAFDGDLRTIHAQAPGKAAELAARGGAASFVHVSAINADPGSASLYASTKGGGEQLVRDAFSAATIIRPSLVFGQEDQLTNRFAGLARLPFLPVIAPRTRFQPVYVRDVAAAIAQAAVDPQAHAGKTYEIGGPEVMTMHELNAAIARLAGQTPELIDVPDFAADALSRLGFLPGMPLTRDQWTMLQKDNVADPANPGLAAFGINPTPLGAVAGEWLSRFQKGGRFPAQHTRSQSTAG